MSEWRQGWLVARREVRERGRSRAFQVSLAFTVLVVVAMIVVPSLIDPADGPTGVGVAGAVPGGLVAAVEEQGTAAGIDVEVHRYGSVAEGEDAVRRDDIDVLVADGRRLVWRQLGDPALRSSLTAALRRVALAERAQAAGIAPGDLAALVAPVPIDDVELVEASASSGDDELVAVVMNVLLFMTIMSYGAMVLTGVVEEKQSRVVEVLLARMPARTLLAGKIAGIGLLGLVQIGVLALLALAATALAGGVEVPAVTGSVLAWAVVWFVLGYALYATVFGTLGSLASRSEDAQSIAGPVTVVLVLGYFASIAAIGSPGSVWARFVSFFPATAPLAMPNRLALGGAAWWEPVAAAILAIAAIALLVQAGGRVYVRAILHTGPTLRMRDVLRDRPTPPAWTDTPAG